MIKNAPVATVGTAPADRVHFWDFIRHGSFGFRSSQTTALLIAAVACVGMLSINVFRRTAFSGDEGFYGVTAENMLHSTSYILEPSYYPMGNFATDKGGFAHPPFNSYFYALSLWLFEGSLAGPEMVNAIAFALLLFFSFQLLRLFETRAAIFAVLLLAASPASYAYYSQLEAEPLMTTAGIAALYFALRTGTNDRRRALAGRNEEEKKSHLLIHGRQSLTAKRRLLASPAAMWFLSGLCLGLAFALKLWLCGPLALAVAAALCARAFLARGSVRAVVIGVILFFAGVVIPAGTHLLAIAIFHPADLGFWLKDIYFGIFTNAGISGSKAEGQGVSSEWIHPVWYYGAALYRDHFFLLPITLFGFGPLLRNRRLNGVLLWVTLAGVAGLLPLSLIKVKEPLYVLSCSTFLYYLAAMCASALIKEVRSGEHTARNGQLARVLLPLAVLGLLLAVPLAYAKGIQPDRITSRFVIEHSIAFGLSLGFYLWAIRARMGRVLEWGLFAGCAAGVLLAIGRGMAQPPRDRTVSRLLQSSLEANAPGELSFIGSNFKCYQFYTFRRGCYWHEIPLDREPEELMRTPEFSEVRAFILDSEDQRKPTMEPWVHWLERNTRERTAELNATLGRATGVRIFVRGEAFQPLGS